MSVSLPIFQSTPTLEQMKSIDYFDYDIAQQSTGYISEAASNNIFVARTTDYQNYADIFGGSYNPNKSNNYCYILYAKTNTPVIRWVYTQKKGEYIADYSPWYANIIEYNGTRYAVAVPSFYTDDEFVVTGCWANCPVYSSTADFFANEQPIPYTGTAYLITYRDTNCVSDGPTEASVGDVVQVDYTFPDGYGIVNPSTDIYVTNNGVVVPSSYSNGTLTFTMPDPS